MKKIHKLSPHLIAQIAAGEVIERPSYAVKELLDNAVDAKATEITVSLENFGLRKISVTDNGEGMSKDDLFDSYKIHTTSKVKNEDSLTAIKSMGFRGEALASIAAISHLTIKSRTLKDVAGNFIEIDNGKLIKDGPVGMPTGTTIEIENIFAKIPARKKFLKTPTTELRQIIGVFISFALTFPQIRFTLLHNKKIVYELKTSDILTRISELLSETTIQQLIPIKQTDSYLKLSGFLARPQLTTQASSKQYIFINNRRVTDKLISQAIKDSYASLIPDKQQPVYLLFLTVPYELVDVNVHPRKEQIAFFNTQQIYDTITKAVSETLQNHNLTFSHLSNKQDPVTKSITGDLLRNAITPWQVKKEQLKIDYQTLQQMHNLFLVIQTKQGILFVDQHAAHERILFEQFKREFLDKKTKTIKLAKPFETHFSIQEKLIIDEYYQELETIGIVIDRKKYALQQIPLIFKDRNIAKMLKELLEDLEQKNTVHSIDQTSLKIIQFLACKNAVKAGDLLAKDEAINLVKKLEQTENNFTCPHGRPTKYLFSLNELNKLFKRF